MTSGASGVGARVGRSERAPNPPPTTHQDPVRPRFYRRRRPGPRLPSFLARCENLHASHHNGSGAKVKLPGSGGKVGAGQVVRRVTCGALRMPAQAIAPATRGTSHARRRAGTATG